MAIHLFIYIHTRTHTHTHTHIQAPIPPAPFSTHPAAGRCHFPPGHHLPHADSAAAEWGGWVGDGGREGGRCTGLTHFFPSSTPIHNHTHTHTHPDTAHAHTQAIARLLALLPPPLRSIDYLDEAPPPPPASATHNEVNTTTTTSTTSSAVAALALGAVEEGGKKKRREHESQVAAHQHQAAAVSRNVAVALLAIARCVPCLPCLVCVYERRMRCCFVHSCIFLNKKKDDQVIMPTR